VSSKLEALKQRLAARRPKGPVKKMIVERNQKVGISVGEIKAAIEARPDHSHAEAFGQGIRLGTPEEMDEDQEIFVDQVDLEALLQGAEVETVEEVIDGEAFQVKQLTGGKAPLAPAPKPKDKPEED